MANRKREKPLTLEEKRARDARYQHNRRHKTNNGYARAYNRASKRAVDWFKEHHRPEWNKWLEEELSKIESKPYQPGGPTAMIHDGNITFCDHSQKTIIGFSTACAICGKLLGAVEIEERDRAELNNKYELP